MRKRIVTAVVVLLAIGLVFAGRHFRKLAIIGAGYAAEQTCGCMFISGRSLDSCRGDLESMARRIVTLEPGDLEVHASTLLSTATARYQPGFGCTIE